MPRQIDGCASFAQRHHKHLYETRHLRRALLYSWHSNQHEANASGIEDRAHLLEASHFQAIGFIHQNESRRVTNGALLVRVTAADLSERWFKGWQLF
jgi:hypothetical protein